MFFLIKLTSKKSICFQRDSITESTNTSMISLINNFSRPQMYTKVGNFKNSHVAIKKISKPVANPPSKSILLEFKRVSIFLLNILNKQLNKNNFKY